MSSSASFSASSRIAARAAADVRGTGAGAVGAVLVGLGLLDTTKENSQKSGKIFFKKGSIDFFVEDDCVAISGEAQKVFSATINL